MVWDEEWDANQYTPSAADKGSGEAWERLNNQLFVEWQQFTKRLGRLAERRDEANRPLTAAERAGHVSAFRDLLTSRYGRSSVDQRWDAERANRLHAREQPSRKAYAP